MYLAASEHAVSVAIVREDYRVQRPVYYTNKTLDEAKSRYLPLEKLAFALVYSAKKLPHYFQVHTMIVLMEHPLKVCIKKCRLLQTDIQMGSLTWGLRHQITTKDLD